MAEVYGNYLGFMEFNGKRYWDVREQMTYPVNGKFIQESLPSDSRLRIDSQ